MMKAYLVSEVILQKLGHVQKKMYAGHWPNCSTYAQRLPILAHST